MSTLSLEPMTTEPSLQPTTAVKRPRLRRAVFWLSVVNAIGLLGLWIWMRWEGDRSWLATLFLFGPRWTCGLLLPVLGVAALLWNRRALVFVGLGVLLVVGPIMGFEFNWSGSGDKHSLRLMTLNVDQYHYDAVKILNLIEDEQVDVVLLQEVASGAKFFWPENWTAVHRDEYLVASHYLLRPQDGVLRPTIPGKLAGMRFEIDLPQGTFQLFDVHLPTPRYGFKALLDTNKGVEAGAESLEAMLKMRANEARLVSEWIAHYPGPKIVAGDFNTPVESRIFGEYFGDWPNAFSLSGWGFGFTKITGNERFHYGSRIDHVLATPPCACSGPGSGRTWGRTTCHSGRL